MKTMRRFKSGDTVQVVPKGAVMKVIKYLSRKKGSGELVTGAKLIECVWYEVSSGLRRKGYFHEKSLVKLSK